MADYAITAEGDDGNLSQNATGTTGSIVTAPSGGNLLAAVTYDWTDTQAINGLRKGFLCFRDLALDPGQTIIGAQIRLTVHAFACSC